MSVSSHPSTPFGASIKRREDPRFITGRGQYTSDITPVGTTHAAFVRSPYAHARIKSVDARSAREMPGVRAIFIGADLTAAGVNGIPVGWVIPGMKLPTHMPLAVDRVRHVGEAVAVVIADSAYAARDAAELIAVDYDPLPAVAETASALDNPTQIHEGAPGNLCFHWSIGDAATTDAAFANAAHVVRQDFVNTRLAPVAIEPRASVATYNPSTGDLTLYVTSQNPHVHRLMIGAFVLGLPEHKFRVVAPDVGGGFGSKAFIYPEEVVVARARSRNNGRDGDRARRQGAGRAGEDDGEHGGVPHVVRRRHPDVSVRHADVGTVHHRRHSLRGGRRLHEHGAGRRVSRCGPP
jgi:carbon-monoxide dehydrogenase large subunit